MPVWGNRRSPIVNVRLDGPCGDTSVSEADVAEARRLFVQQVPAVTSGLSMVQQLAVDASVGTTTDRSPHSGDSSNARTIALDFDERSDGTGIAGLVTTGRATRSTDMSRKVVNSHLQFFHRYPAFRDGDFTKESLYGFLFFAVVENKLRVCYAKRVLRNLLSYARKYLAEHSAGGVDGNLSDSAARLSVPIERADGRTSTLEIRLTPASVAFFRDNPRGLVVQMKRFYQLMNSVGNQTNNENLKNVVCEARRPRELVFSDEQNAALLRFVFVTLRVILYKYSARSSEDETTMSSRPDRGVPASVESAVERFVSPDTATNTDRRQVIAERTVFEFCVAFLLSFLTGARTKSTITRLTIREFVSLTRGVTLEKFTKGSFVRMFVPAQFTDKPDCSESRVGSTTGEARRRWNVYTQQEDEVQLKNRLLCGAAQTRRDPYLYDTKRTDQDYFFLAGGRQLDYVFDRIYSTLFGHRRPKGVLWHSQRRRYLGSVNEKYGAVTASKSVGHADVETTMLYINNSLHGDDTNRRAGSAIYEETVRLLGS